MMYERDMDVLKTAVGDCPPGTKVVVDADALRRLIDRYEAAYKAARYSSSTHLAGVKNALGIESQW